MSTEKKLPFIIIFLAFFMPFYWIPFFSTPNDQLFINLIALFTIITTVNCLLRRNKYLKKSGWSSAISILRDDYSFSQYVSLNVLSLIYAVGQALWTSILCLGYGYLVNIIFRNIGASSTSSVDWGGLIQLVYGLIGSTLLLVLTRVLIESYALLYSTSRSIQDYCKRMDE